MLIDQRLHMTVQAKDCDALGMTDSALVRFFGKAEASYRQSWASLIWQPQLEKEVIEVGAHPRPTVGKSVVLTTVIDEVRDNRAILLQVLQVKGNSMVRRQLFLERIAP